jgi:Apea-like HEPN
VRNYPQEFEQSDWDAPVPLVNQEQVIAIKKCFLALRQHASNKRLSIATRRLNRRALRTSPEDSVIDLTIGLEALFADGNQEMTHKIALRAAALYKLTDPSKSRDVFKEIKEVYKLRSAIVHGDNVDANKTVSTRSLSVEDAAVEHLRALLQILLQNPEFLDPAVIDHQLLLGSGDGYLAST